MTIKEVKQLLGDIEAAIEPWVADGDDEVIRAAAEAALMVLVDAGVIDGKG